MTTKIIKARDLAEAIKRLTPADGYTTVDCIRAILLADGTAYAWDGLKTLHQDVAAKKGVGGVWLLWHNMDPMADSPTRAVFAPHLRQADDYDAAYLAAQKWMRSSDVQKWESRQWGNC